ncbi:hypothetical protein llap_14492 [Limosa lapponica baueri]|uniref:Uncharacterized protein n=1 Tax=Limosa lapponica baueri TaxID=1758121 RepID=A0A2I0TN32_LIMLA|nr:hypothetical protein llap_14492 [Limosa lapponica baueri]
MNTAAQAASNLAITDETTCIDDQQIEYFIPSEWKQDKRKFEELDWDDWMKWVVLQEDLFVERLVIATRQSGSQPVVHRFVAQECSLREDMEQDDTSPDILSPVEQPLEYKSDVDSTSVPAFHFDTDAFILSDL